MTVHVSDLTEGEVAGKGLFDLLMRTVSKHLDDQVKSNRIGGAEYAQVYIASLNAVLQQSGSFLLAFEQTNKQVQLLDKQIENAAANTAMLVEQKNKLIADTAIATKQLLVMDEQVSQAQTQTALIAQQKVNAVKELELMQKQVEKADADIELVEQQTANTLNQNTTITKAQEKSDVEKELLAQKVETEKAQTEGTYLTTDGVLGANMTVLKKQAEGFDRNAEQKLAKMLIDSWTVRQTTDGAEVTYNGLVDTEINKVLNQAKVGIGLAPFVAPNP